MKSLVVLLTVLCVVLAGAVPEPSSFMLLGSGLLGLLGLMRRNL